MISCDGCARGRGADNEIAATAAGSVARALRAAVHLCQLLDDVQRSGVVENGEDGHQVGMGNAREDQQLSPHGALLCGVQPKLAYALRAGSRAGSNRWCAPRVPNKRRMLANRAALALIATVVPETVSRPSKTSPSSPSPSLRMTEGERRVVREGLVPTRWWAEASARALTCEPLEIPRRRGVLEERARAGRAEHWQLRSRETTRTSAHAGTQRRALAAARHRRGQV